MGDRASSNPVSDPVVRSDTRSVFLLWHQYDAADYATTLLLGVYSTQRQAHDRLHSARALPGFCLYPEAFRIAEYLLDDDQWRDGFLTVGP